MPRDIKVLLNCRTAQPPGEEGRGSPVYMEIIIKKEYANVLVYCINKGRDMLFEKKWLKKELGL
jgi:hypothetical protein